MVSNNSPSPTHPNLMMIQTWIVPLSGAAVGQCANLHEMEQGDSFAAVPWHTKPKQYTSSVRTGSIPCATVDDMLSYCCILFCASQSEVLHLQMLQISMYVCNDNAAVSSTALVANCYGS